MVSAPPAGGSTAFISSPGHDVTGRFPLLHVNKAHLSSAEPGPEPGCNHNPDRIRGAAADSLRDGLNQNRNHVYGRPILRR